jgi:hypothetical protein
VFRNTAGVLVKREIVSTSEPGETQAALQQIAAELRNLGQRVDMMTRGIDLITQLLGRQAREEPRSEVK